MEPIALSSDLFVSRAFFRLNAIFWHLFPIVRVLLAERDQLHPSDRRPRGGRAAQLSPASRTRTLHPAGQRSRQLRAARPALRVRRSLTIIFHYFLPSAECFFMSCGSNDRGGGGGYYRGGGGGVGGRGRGYVRDYNDRGGGYRDYGYQQREYRPPSRYGLCDTASLGL